MATQKKAQTSGAKKTTAKGSNSSQSAQAAPSPGDRTVGDLRIELLEQRLGEQASRYEREINEMQIRFLLDKQNLLQQIEELKSANK